MKQNIEVVRKSAEPKHSCALPGWWQRRRLRLRAGAQVRCLDCMVVWQLDSAVWIRSYERQP